MPRLLVDFVAWLFLEEQPVVLFVEVGVGGDLAFYLGLSLLLYLRKKHIFYLLLPPTLRGHILHRIRLQTLQISLSVHHLRLQRLIIGLRQNIGEIVQVLGQNNRFHEIRVPFRRLNQKLVRQLVLDSGELQH